MGRGVVRGFRKGPITHKRKVSQSPASAISDKVCPRGELSLRPRIRAQGHPSPYTHTHSPTLECVDREVRPHIFTFCLSRSLSLPRSPGRFSFRFAVFGNQRPRYRPGPKGVRRLKSLGVCARPPAREPALHLAESERARESERRWSRYAKFALDFEYVCFRSGCSLDRSAHR